MRLLRWTVELLASSWRFEVVGAEWLEHLHDSGTSVIYSVWHGAILPGLWRHRGTATTLLVSRHADGGRVASAAHAWGYQVVRGSSTRGGARGLRGLVHALENGGDVAITPDGPRGPAHVVKPGVIAAARHAGATIVPVGISASSQWRVRSWDRFLIPRPFALVRMVYGEPFALDPATSLADSVKRLQEQMSRATERATCNA